MRHGDSSELIRQRAWDAYIQPQIKSGNRHIRLAIKPLMKELEAEGFPRNHPRQFCTALQKKQFLRERDLLLTRVEGPPSGTSTTVVLHYEYGGVVDGLIADQNHEAAKKRALEAADRLFGLYREEIQRRGGTEAFIRWVRSDEDEDTE